MAILDSTGAAVVTYTYDAWGNILTTGGSMASTLGVINPLTYRGYVYDHETELYYLQSRYYNPEWGRFLNADALVSTGQGELGNNMFAYCNNNPVNYCDASGQYALQAAFELFYTWIDGDGTTQYYSENSRMVKLLKKSSKMQKYIYQALENYVIKDEKVTRGTGEFTGSEDGYELYLSTQHFTYCISVTEERRTRGFWFWKHEEVRYTATVTVYDTYDFDEFRDWNSFGSIMNNLAYIYSFFGGNDYDWYATYTYTTEWTDVN